MQRSYSRLYYAASADEEVAGLSHAAFRLWVMSQARACAKGTAGTINARAAGNVARWSQLDKDEVPAAIAELVFGSFWLATADTARNEKGEPTEYLIRNFQKFQVAAAYEEDAETVIPVTEVGTLKEVTARLYALLDAEAARNDKASYAAVCENAIPAAIRKYSKHEPDCSCGLETCQTGLKGLGNGSALYDTAVGHAADQFLGRLEFGSPERARRARALSAQRKEHGALAVIEAIEIAAKAGKPALAYINGILRSN